MASNQPRNIKSQTLVRGLMIMEAVAKDPLTIHEISIETGISYSTAHRIISALVEKHYLTLNSEKRYGLGSQIVALGFAAHQQIDIVRVAHPYLKYLAEKTSDTVHFARIEDNEVIYLDKIRSTRPVEISSRIGGRKPLVTTGVGKALLLNKSDQELSHYLNISIRKLDHENYIDRESWMSSMKEYRHQGYAFDFGEDEPSIRCVAVPVYDGSGEIVAAVSVSSTIEYMSEARMHELVAEVGKTADKISQHLGGKGKLRIA